MCTLQTLLVSSLLMSARCQQLPACAHDRDGIVAVTLAYCETHQQIADRGHSLLEKCTMSLAQTHFVAHRPNCTLSAGFQTKRGVPARFQPFRREIDLKCSHIRQHERDNHRSSQLNIRSDGSPSTGNVMLAASGSTFGLWLLSELPALAAETTDFSKGGFAKESYYVTLGLFLISLPGAPCPKPEVY